MSDAAASDTLVLTRTVMSTNSSQEPPCSHEFVPGNGEQHIFSTQKTKDNEQILTNSKQNIDAQKEITLYPNPVKTSLKIDYPGWNHKLIRWSILDTKGQVVKEAEGLVSFYEGMDIDVKDLPGGVYILNLNYQSIQKTLKFIRP